LGRIYHLFRLVIVVVLFFYAEHRHKPLLSHCQDI
jgi:hypothetical protein